MTDLPSITTKKKKRVGRGYGSGKGGHTAGRGAKGQKARSKVHILFEGVKMKKSLIKRLPLKRGKGKFKAKQKPIIVNIKYLDILPSNSKVNIETLSKRRIVNKEQAIECGVKVLGNEKITKKLIVEVPISNSAAKIIEKAGGKIQLPKPKVAKSKKK